MTDLERFDLRPTVRMHFRGMRDRRTGRLSVSTWTLTVVVPLAAATVAPLLDVQIVQSGPLITATSLLIGGMLSLFVFLTNLRIKLSEVDDFKFRRRVQQQVAYTSASCLYVALLALLGTVSLAIGFSVHVPGLPIWVTTLGGGLAVALLVHLSITLLTVIRRVFGVYNALYKADFTADLRPVDEDGQTSQSA